MAQAKEKPIAEVKKPVIALYEKHVQEIESYLQELPFKYSSSLMSYLAKLAQEQNPGSPLRVGIPVKKTVAKKATTKKRK